MQEHRWPEPVFQLVPMTETHAREICRWRYEPPYDIYAWKSWPELVQRREEIGDPIIRDEQYASVLLGPEDAAPLAGFAQFFPLEGWVRLGLGMQPGLRGRGWGAAMVGAIVREAQRRYPDRAVDLEVLVWNRRAVRTYERAGFVIEDEYDRPTPTGAGRFYCMVYRPAPE